jgi:hypothetical protein
MIFSHINLVWRIEPLLGKPRNIHASNNIRTVFCMWSAPRPLLSNGAVNTPLDCIFCMVPAEELGCEKKTLCVLLLQ